MSGHLLIFIKSVLRKTLGDVLRKYQAISYIKIRHCLTRQIGTGFGRKDLMLTDVRFLEKNAAEIRKRPDIKRGMVTSSPGGCLANSAPAGVKERQNNEREN
jgi:hypothetical protein